MSGARSNGDGPYDDVVVRKAEHGWVVGEENVSDLTSAMVLADLFAADNAGNDDTGLMPAVDAHGAPRQTPGHTPRHAAPPGPRVNPTGPQRAVPHSPGPHSPGPHSPGPHSPGSHGPGSHNPGPHASGESAEAARLAVTVSQLEHALASRVRVEQAIGVLAERNRLRPREAFDLLRRAARARGQRVTELAQDVVASTANPLLRLPDELSRKLPDARPRGRSLRRRPAEQF
jgi:hypothetical protein